MAAPLMVADRTAAIFGVAHEYILHSSTLLRRKTAYSYVQFRVCPDRRFCVAAARKPRVYLKSDIPGVAQDIYSYRLLPPELIGFIAASLPWLEIVLGSALIIGVWTEAATLMSALLSVILTFAVGSALWRHTLWMLSWKRHRIQRASNDCLAVEKTTARTANSKVCQQRANLIKFKFCLSKKASEIRRYLASRAKRGPHGLRFRLT